jgi:hypothetical protein
VSKQAAVASVVFVDVQTMLLDNLGSSSQCCRDGRITNVWQRVDENFLDFFLCEAVIEPVHTAAFRNMQSSFPDELDRYFNVRMQTLMHCACMCRSL